MTTQEINNLVSANTKLVDQVRLLTKENKEFKKALLQIEYLVKQTREYMHDGVDEELLDILKEVI